MILNSQLSIARQRGIQIQAVDRQGNAVHVVRYMHCDQTSNPPTTKEALTSYRPALVVAEGSQDEYTTDVQLPMTSYEVLREAELAHALEVGFATLESHLDDMREAFPELKIYAAKSLDLLSPNQAAVIAAYGQYKHPDSELEILKGFGAHGSLTYAEVELWRYKELPPPQA